MRTLLLLLALTARAQAATAEEEAARVHFLSGQAYYDQANYDDALREFTEAYRISQKPALLYNLAVCYERLGHVEAAISALQSYLDAVPDAPDRVAVEGRIGNLVRRLKKAPPPVVADKPPVADKPAVKSPPPRRRVATWVVGGLGVGLLAGALASGVIAEVRFKNLKNDCGGDFSCSIPNLEARKSDGRAAAIATDVLWPLGTAAIVGAVIAYVFEGRPQKLRASAGGVAFAF